MKKTIILTLFLFQIGFSARAESLVAGQRFKHVIQVVFENTDYDQALAQPDFAALVRKGALFTNFSAEAHPSQANYIAMIAGDTLGVRGDSPIDLNDRHLGDLLETANLRWRVYAEDYPGNCFAGARSGNYVRKHNPFISFTNISRSAARCANIVEAAEFDRDASSGSLPEFSFYVPNLKNDGHDTGVNFAGNWLTRKFGPLLRDPNFLRDTLLMITFDESEGHGPNQIFTVLLGGSVRPGSVNNTALSHVSLLRLIEDEFNLGSLGRQDQSTSTVEGIWN